jgi:hypothetical protein
MAAQQQITMHRTEVLKLLRHVQDIRTAVTRATDRLYQSEFDEIEDQLLAMKSEIDSILCYFEVEHQVGIRRS